jgi:hypothetical protein
MSSWPSGTRAAEGRSVHPAHLWLEATQAQLHVLLAKRVLLVPPFLDILERLL